MSTQADDRILWVAIGISLLAAYHYIPWQLRHVRQLTELKGKASDQDDALIKRKDDHSLQINSLKILALSANFNQRAAATKIIAEISSKGLARNQLLRDVAGNDTDARDKALVALKFLLTSRLIHRTSNTIIHLCHEYKTYKAVVDCLVKFLPQHDAPFTESDGRPVPFIPAVSPIHPPRRPYHERTAIDILNTIIHIKLPYALCAGVVSRWLSKYPFPCADPANPGRRQDVQEISASWWRDDPLMSEIVRFISQDTVGRMQLRQYGLMPPIQSVEPYSVAPDDNGNVSPSDCSSEDVRMGDGNDTAGLVPHQDTPTASPLLEETSHGHPRPRNDGAESAEEQNRRHRRREAIVISDGDGPLGRENIIEPIGLERESRGSRSRPQSRGNNTNTHTTAPSTHRDDRPRVSSLGPILPGPTPEPIPEVEDTPPVSEVESSPPISEVEGSPPIPWSRLVFVAFGPNDEVNQSRDPGELFRPALSPVPSWPRGGRSPPPPPVLTAEEMGLLRGNREVAGGDREEEEGSGSGSGGRSRRQSFGWVEWVRERWRWGE